MLAACTPPGLRKQLRNLPEDGLIHRFLPCILRTPQAEQDGDAAEGLSAWNVRIRDIYQRTTGDTTSARARFARDAEALFDAEATELRKIVSALADAAPSLAPHVGKHPGMLARVALVFHVLDARPSDAIEIDTLRRAIQFMRCARKHANAMFGDILGASPTFELARALARSIVADSSRPASIGRNWMLQHCRQFKVAPGDLEKRAAIALLEDARWLAPVVDSRPYGGWQASEWIIDARVYDLFAAEGESHRARRAVVREAFLGG